MAKDKLPEATVNLNEEEKAELINEVIHKHKLDLMEMMVREHIYQLEYAKPTNISKSQAEEGLATYQARIRHLKENIFALELYAKDHNITL